MKIIIFCLLTLVLSFGLAAQSGEIAGRVTDDRGEGVPFATITANLGGNVQGAITDFDGYFSIKPLPAGNYTVELNYLGMAPYKSTGVTVNPDRITSLDISLKPEVTDLIVVEIVEYKRPLIRKDETTTGGIITKEDIKNLSTRSVTSIASTTAAIFQSDEGSGLNVKGTRSNSTDTYLDGMKMRGSNTIPSAALEQVEMITGGVPPRYGDATGGIISVTTSAPAKNLSGRVEGETSQFLDAFGHNLGSLYLNGPLIKTKKNETGYNRTLLGFTFVGQYLHQKDDDPSAVGIYKVTDEVRDNLIANPLIRSVNSTGLLQSAQFLGADDFEYVKARVNMAKQEISSLGSLVLSPTDKISVTVGAGFNDRDGGASAFGGGINRWYAFDWDHLPNFRERDIRGYVRFSQRFDSEFTEEELKERKEPILSNANYSLQMDLTKNYSRTQDPIHKDRFFDYGYIGRFDQSRTPLYIQQNVDLVNPDGTPVSLNGRVFAGYQSNGVSYTPGSVNPEAIAYNNQYFNLIGDQLAEDIRLIPGQEGLINGSRSGGATSYSLYYTPIANYDFFDKTENDQYRLTFNGSVDAKARNKGDKSRHSFQLGLEYEQRIDRDWNISPEGLWDRMRQKIAAQGSSGDIQLDTDNPILQINGQQIALSDYNPAIHGNFTSYDTITYNYVRLVNSLGELSGSDFDFNFRNRFGLNLTDYVNTDTYTPDQLSLDLFSPDDLFGSGNNDNLLEYYGYDYIGNKLEKQPSFNDFWTATDDKGQKTRPIAAFRPNYVAGYIQDKFSFKDLVFRVGARVDRFDANTKVLKDPYSLYGVRKAGEVSEINGQTIIHPGTIGEDFVVYVDNGYNPTTIKGYRNGDTWYDASGTLITDPKIIGESGAPIPYLSHPLSPQPRSDIKEKNFDPNTAFEDYTPQINIMPRIAFSFPISDVAQFFAHYDVLTQRPQGRIVATPMHYYFFNERAVDNTFNNPNLKPEKTVDYQVGYKQVVSPTSVIEITAFYKELRDMVQVTNVNFAYPTSYTTYGNVDFGTTKGFTFTYDMRKTGNVRMVATYTLQFADGTGSSDRSAVNLAGNGQPNLRSIQPLDFDSRHMLNLSVDYRFADGAKYNGPKIKDHNLLSNFGINTIIRARSGTPYTQQRFATPTAAFGIANRTTLEGQINGSRLPWNLDIDTKIDKTIFLGKGEDANSIQLYFMIQNILNRKNVQSVYSYTGRADDDGYLGSQNGITDALGRLDPDSFSYQYGVKLLDPNKYAQPRTIRFGISYSF